MRFLRRFLTRLANFATRRRDDERLKEEIEEHLALQTVENIKGGLPLGEARRQAMLKFGAVEAIKDEYRAERGLLFIDTLLQDIRFALRMLRKSPGFAAMAILTLALGIGANTAIFSVANAVLIRSLPYRDANRLVFLSDVIHSSRGEQSQSAPISYPDFLDWQSQSDLFDGLAAYQPCSFTLTGVGDAMRVPGRNVSADFFQVFGVSPVLGRTFVPSDDRPGAARIVVLSYGFWRSKFGGDSRIINRFIELDNKPYAVVGVLPADFRFSAPADVYASLGILADEFFMSRAKHPFIYGIARLKHRATLDSARTQMAAIAANLAREYPGTNSDIGVSVESLQAHFDVTIRPMLLALMSGAALLLLIACTNVANLCLARGARRSGEITVRFALGASRFRVIRQFVTEGLVLAVASGLVALLAGEWGMRLARRLLSPELQSIVAMRVDPSVVAFTFGMSFLTATLFEIVPSLQYSRIDLQSALKQSGKASTADHARKHLRPALVISEVALGVIVLICAGLAIRTFRAVSALSPGFDPHHVLTMRLQLSDSAYSKDSQIIAFYQLTLDRIAALPGVEAAAAAMPLPLMSDNYADNFFIEGRPLPAEGQFPLSTFHFVSPGYFRAMGIPLRRGRDFAIEDNESSRPVAIVSESFAKRYWPAGDAIGKRFHTGSSAVRGRWLAIIGIVGDTKETGLDAPTKMSFYLPLYQGPIPFVTLAVRTRTPTLGLASEVARAVRMLDKNVPLYAIETMEQYAGDSLNTRSSAALLFSILAGLTVFLAATGVYAAFSYAVAQRTHEIGIRIALGAQRGSILRLVIGQGLTVAGIGIAAGIGAAFGLTRLMTNLLYGVTPTDPATFIGVAILLLIVALIACYVPARRAMRVHPMLALRYE